MTTYLTSPLAADVVKVRWQEPYVTSGLNQKTFGQYAKGVFAGFTVVPSGVALTVELLVDPTLRISGANVLNTSTNNYCVTVVHTDTISLLLPFSQTVYIVLEAQYQVGATSTAQVRVVDLSELSNTELIILAKVNVPAAGVIATSQINMGYRHSAGDAVTREAQPPFNLLSNGTFERDAIASVPAGWVSSNVGLSVGVSGLLPRTGGLHSMVVSSVGVISANVASGPMPVVPLDTYRAGAWIRSVGGSPIAVGTASIQVEWLDAAGASISVINIEGTFSGGSTTWVERKAEVTAPATASTAKLRAAFNGCSGTLYVDDALFLTRHQDQLATTSVFGGPTSIADAFHLHSSGTQAYGPGPAWFDGTTNPVTTVSGQLDKIVNDLSHATTGTAKIGNAPNKILNNVFVNSIVNTPAIDATGNGTGAGVVARSGTSTAASGAWGICRGENGYGTTGTVDASVTNATGVLGVGKGTGPGVYGSGGTTAPVDWASIASGTGVEAIGGAALTNGVVGRGGSIITPGTVTGAFYNSGVIGVGSSIGFGVVGVSAKTSGAIGVLGIGSEGAVDCVGVTGQGSGTGSGVEGFNYTNGYGGKFGGFATKAGVHTTGGATAPVSNITLENGAGLVGIGGSGGGSGIYGRSGNATEIGTTAATHKAGVLGIGTGAFGRGVVGIAAAYNNNGTYGVAGFGSDGFNSSGVAGFGVGTGVGGVFVGGASGNAVSIGTGHAYFSGGNPVPSVAFTNTVTPTSIVKAWARVLFANGVRSVQSGFNIASVNDIDQLNGQFSITLATGGFVPLATRIAQIQTMGAAPVCAYVDVYGTPSASVVTFGVFTLIGLPQAAVDLSVGGGNTIAFSIVVYGPQ